MIASFFRIILGHSWFSTALADLWRFTALPRMMDFGCVAILGVLIYSYLFSNIEDLKKINFFFSKMGQP